MRKVLAIFLQAVILISGLAACSLCANPVNEIESLFSDRNGYFEYTIPQSEERLIDQIKMPYSIPLFFALAGKSAVIPEEITEKALKDRLGAYRVVSFLLIILSIQLIIILFILIRTIRQKKKSNQLLLKKNREIKSINEQLRLQNEEIETQKENIELQNQQLLYMHSELDMLLGIVAHDLRSPLNNIRGLLKVIELKNENLTEEQQRYLDLIMLTSVRLTDMVTKILDSNSLESNKLNLNLKPHDVIPLIKEVINNEVEIGKNKGIKIHFESDLNECVVIIDENYTIQVFENLFSNAIKFSPYESNIYVLVHKEEDAMRIQIKDEGPGISSEDMKKLFGKYQKLTARPTAGEPSLGLGLSIVKRYVETMNGKIWCESALGAGATFIIEFPAAL